jgi:hypothetical protein
VARSLARFQAHGLSAALYSIAYKRGMPDHVPPQTPAMLWWGLHGDGKSKSIYTFFYSLFHTCDESIDELFFDV